MATGGGVSAVRGRVRTLALVALLSLSCESGREPAVPPVDSQATSRQRADSRAAEGSSRDSVSVDASPAFDGTVDVTDMPMPPRMPATLQDVRTSRSGGFERVVFDFGTAPLPGYHVRYIVPPAQDCGSGAEVVLAGSSVLSIRFESAQAHDERGDGVMQATVTSRDRALGYPIIRQLRLVCDFEGSLEWVLGLTAQRPYRLLRLENPARLALDIEAAVR